MILKTKLALFFASALLSVAANANLVQNGGFEQTSVSGSTTLSPNSAVTGNQVTGWNSFAASGESWNAIFFPGEATTVGASCDPFCGENSVLWAATESPDGGNFIAIDGDATVAGEISQMINGLTAGTQYTLSFYFAGAQYVTRTGATTEAWQVDFGDARQMTEVLSNESESFTGWFKSEMQFTATSGSQLLTFLAVGAPVGLPPVSLLDGVSLTETNRVSQVPEPGSMALLGAALGALGLTRRRKPAASSPCRR